MKDLIKKHSTLEETKEQLKNTELNLKRATRDLEDSIDPDLSGSVSQLEPPASEWLLAIIKWNVFIV